MGRRRITLVRSRQATGKISSDPTIQVDHSLNQEGEPGIKEKRGGRRMEKFQKGEFEEEEEKDNIKRKKF